MSIEHRHQGGRVYLYFQGGRGNKLYLGSPNELSQIKVDNVKESLDYLLSRVGDYANSVSELVGLLPEDQRQAYFTKLGEILRPQIGKAPIPEKRASLSADNGIVQKVLSSKNKADLLTLFHKDPKLLDTLEGLSRRLGTAESIDEDVKELVELGLLVSKRLGRTEVFFLDRERDKEFQEAVTSYLEDLIKTPSDEKSEPERERDALSVNQPEEAPEITQSVGKKRQGPPKMEVDLDSDHTIDERTVAIIPSSAIEEANDKPRIAEKRRRIQETIGMIGNKLSVPPKLIKSANRIVTSYVTDKDLVEDWEGYLGQTRTMAFVSLYIALERAGSPRSWEELAEASQIPKAELIRQYWTIIRNMERFSSKKRTGQALRLQAERTPPARRKVGTTRNRDVPIEQLSQQAKLALVAIADLIKTLSTEYVELRKAEKVYNDLCDRTGVVDPSRTFSDCIKELQDKGFVDAHLSKASARTLAVAVVRLTSTAPPRLLNELRAEITDI